MSRRSEHQAQQQSGRFPERVEHQHVVVLRSHQPLAVRHVLPRLDVVDDRGHEPGVAGLHCGRVEAGDVLTFCATAAGEQETEGQNEGSAHE